MEIQNVQCSFLFLGKIDVNIRKYVLPKVITMGKMLKMRSDRNFSIGVPIDLRSTRLNCIFDDLVMIALWSAPIMVK